MLSRSTIFAVLFGMIVLLVDCDRQPVMPVNDHQNSLDHAATNVASVALVAFESVTPDSYPLRNHWMRMSPKALKSEIDRVLHCDQSIVAQKWCGSFVHDGANSQVLPEDGGGKLPRILTVWMSVPTRDLAKEPMRLPRSAYPVIHHLFPQWREADAWVTYALRNSRRNCGIQTRVDNSLVTIRSDVANIGVYIVALEITPYRTAVERGHIDCYQTTEIRDGVQERAAAIADGLGARKLEDERRHR